MNKFLLGLVVILLSMLLIGAGQPPLMGRAVAVQTPPTPAVDQAVEAALMAAVQQNRPSVLGFLLYDIVVDHIQYSEDGAAALIWLALADPQTGEVLATEPALSIARIQPNEDPTLANNWSITLHSADDWLAQLDSLPSALFTDELRLRLMDQQDDLQPSAVETFSGYKLPWAQGKAVRLTGSISHFLDYNSCSETACRYAYDFADGTMFALLAAKGGTVKAFNDSYANGNTTHTNYLVLEDQSTVPTTYQLYYHIAQGSVRFRTIGQVVKQGEYIANTDDTGASTGHHLHFHVYKFPSYGGYWQWGNSVRILFADVNFNGGEPRKCSEAVRWPAYGSECYAGIDGRRLTSDDDWLISGNTPAHPPVGSLSSPGNRQMIESSSVLIAGTAVDDIGIERIQVLANWDGSWRSLGDLNKPGSNGVFAQELNLCTASVPDGPFTMMVKVFDHEGSQIVAQPGVLQLVKNFYCGVSIPPAPACTPGSNQVALYSQPNYLGECRRLDLRTAGYTVSELLPVGGDRAASLQVGSNVQAVLYDNAADMNLVRPLGRIETFEANDVNLADNRIGSGRVSGVVVQARSSPPDEPFLLPPGLRWDGTALGSSDSLVLAWEGGAGSTKFDVNLKGPGLPSEGENWTGITGTSLSVGTRPAGTYTWTAKGVNSAGSNTSDQASFTIGSSALSSAGASAVPFNDDMESGEKDWIKNSLWHYGAVTVGDRAETRAWIYNGGTSYESSFWRAGDLTSQPIALPASGVNYLRFKYYVGVENANLDWDQRRVQVLSGTGEYLGELTQLGDDIQETGQWWLNSPPLSLAAYAGRTVRLRFHFNTVDQDYNNGLGWIIDDVSVTNEGPAVNCLPDHNNNTASQAYALTIPAAFQADLCPQGDVDYYSFSGTAGQPIRVDIDAKTLTPSSWLDSQVFLLDADKRSVVAENDDEVLYEKPDSLLNFTLRRTGMYYLKVKAWDSPGAGGPNYAYTLRLEQAQSTRPKAVSLVYPNDKNRIPTVPFEIVVQAEDYDGGPVAQVDFYWHGPDWTGGSWVKLGSDTKGSDGWSFIVHPLLYGPVPGSALYVQAKNSAGAVRGLVVWDLQPDTVTPASQMEELPSLTRSTAIELRWTAQDEQNDIARFDIQYQVNNNGWSNDRVIQQPGSARRVWFMGHPGNTFHFRMRAVDQAGNAEGFLPVPEATTTLDPVCIPDSYDAANDNQRASATQLIWEQSQLHNLCQNDVDWLSFQAAAGQKMFLMGSSRGGGAGMIFSLYNGNGDHMQTWQSTDFGQGLWIGWTAPANGVYYLEVKPFRSELYGSDVLYEVYVGNGRQLYLPLAIR